VIAVWIALGVAVAGIVAGLVAAVVRGFRAWRRFRTVSRMVSVRLDAITHSADEIETHLSRAAESSERLTAALDGLRRSRAVLDVQLGALREARDAVTRAVPFFGVR
jgi:uncharacterized membrane-anchored protein YhcB (DUF1043 family)